MLWLLCVLALAAAQNLTIQVQIVGVNTNNVDPGLLNGIMNGTGNAALAAVNASKVFGVCDVGYWWNVSTCIRCNCSQRAHYPAAWVDIGILK